jgi:phosphoribosylanthranilate isomerase
MPITKLKSVSFIGLDEHTDISRCFELASNYPIEWGFLYGSEPGTAPRYPSEQFIIDVSQLTNQTNIKQSLHLCGNKARDFQKGVASTWYDVFDRFQINLLDKHYDFKALETMQTVFPKVEFVIQHRTSKQPTHCFTPLFDASGGRGVVVDSYPDFSKVAHMGFAGGITPENVLEVNAKVTANSYYLDMESGIRTNDWLDLDKCESICEQLWS